MDRQHHDLLEVDDVDRYWKELLALDLPAKYKGVRLTPVRRLEWGSECFCMTHREYSGILPVQPTVETGASDKSTGFYTNWLCCVAAECYAVQECDASKA